MHDDHLSIVCWCEEGYYLAIAFHLDNWIHRKQFARSESPQSCPTLGSFRDNVEDARVLPIHTPADDPAFDLTIEVQLDNLEEAVLILLYFDFLKRAVLK